MQNEIKFIPLHLKIERNLKIVRQKRGHFYGYTNVKKPIKNKDK